MFETWKPKLSCQLTDMFVVLAADTWLSQTPEPFQSSLGYKSQQDSLLDFIYHRPWIITGLSLSLAVITYFRCSHTLQNQICPSDDLLCNCRPWCRLHALCQIVGSNHFNLRFNVAEWLCALGNIRSMRRTSRALLPSACEDVMITSLGGTISARRSDNVFQSIMPDEEAGTHTGIF